MSAARASTLVMCTASRLDRKQVRPDRTKVDAQIVDTMYAKIPDFRRAYDPDGMAVAEFDSYGATVRTLRTFIAAVHDLNGVIRDFMLPNPDVK